MIGAMSLATALSIKADNPLVTTASFSIATLVGLQRIYQQKHWTSDVIAATVLGIAISSTTVRWRERQRLAP